MCVFLAKHRKGVAIELVGDLHCIHPIVIGLRPIPVAMMTINPIVIGLRPIPVAAYNDGPDFLINYPLVMTNVAIESDH